MTEQGQDGAMFLINSLQSVDVVVSKTQPLFLTLALHLLSTIVIRNKVKLKNGLKKLMYCILLRSQGGLVVITGMYQEEDRNLFCRHAERRL